MLLEVIVQSIDDARAAARGGADRLEVVRDIDRRGLTPDLDLVRAIASNVDVPLRIMIRESDGFTVSNAKEVTRLQRALASFAELPIDGVVVGFARAAMLDLDLTRTVLSAAPTLRATFHHAFDEADRPIEAIKALKQIPQIDRVLTAGGHGSWAERNRQLATYVEEGAGRLTILAGGGIDADGLRGLAAAGVVAEVHVGRAAREPQLSAAPVSADRVKRLKALTAPAK
jgi:copper homeostasis protein